MRRLADPLLPMEVLAARVAVFRPSPERHRSLSPVVVPALSTSEHLDLAAPLAPPRLLIDLHGHRLVPTTARCLFSPQSHPGHLAQRVPATCPLPSALSSLPCLENS